LDRANRLCNAVARRITPSRAERDRVHRLGDQLRARLLAEAERESLETEVRLDGSVAKDTWLRGDADIDIFLRVPTSLSRADLERRCLNVAKRALKDYRIVERFAEHPYVEAHVGRTRVNVVPCYRVERGQWRSATDRTPFHTDYVISHLSPTQTSEVRLLKAFLKGTGVYGAEVRVSGFSGMLCETLIMHYGSFTKTLEAAQSWKPLVLIDLEHHYKGRESEVPDLFQEPLVVIDPVDPGRNLAAAVSRRKLWEFVAAARTFTKKPAMMFFSAPRVKPLSARRFRREMERRDWNIIAIEFGQVDAVVDVLWSQLYRTEKALRNLLRQEGFNVTRSASWSNELDLNVIIFELDRVTLSPVRKHVGPHVARLRASERFLEKHLKGARSISGPWVDDERWAVGQLRESTDAAEFLQAKIRDGCRRSGVASRIAPVLKRRCSIVRGPTLVALYGKNKGAARFITSFLKGRPTWLE